MFCSNLAVLVVVSSALSAAKIYETTPVVALDANARGSYILQAQTGVIERPDDPDDECATLTPPPWCVFGHKPEGRESEAFGKRPDLFDRLDKNLPSTVGPEIRIPKDERKQLRAE